MSATQEVAAAPAKKSGWFKTVLGTVAGTIFGAVLMQLSPWVEKLTKPGKPVANFRVETDGLNVNFHNLASNGTECRWDFGDGSPLEIVAMDRPMISHTFARPGVYTVKQIVRNLFEEADRVVSVEVASTKTVSVEKPAIVDLLVRSPGKVGQSIFAPARFQFQATADHSQTLIWDFGDGSGIHLGDPQTAHTYDKAGTYTVRLVAFNAKGDKTNQESVIEVSAATQGMLNVSLEVVDQGVLVESRRREVPISKSVAVDPKKGPNVVEQVIPVSPGFEIASVERRNEANHSSGIEKAKWELTADRKSLRVWSDIPKVSTSRTVIMNESLIVTEERRTKQSRDANALTATIPAPGSTTLRMPNVPLDWTEVKRQYSVVVKQEGKIVWQGKQLPQGEPIQLNGQAYTLTANENGSRVQIELAESTVGISLREMQRLH